MNYSVNKLKFDLDEFNFKKCIKEAENTSKILSIKIKANKKNYWFLCRKDKNGIPKFLDRRGNLNKIIESKINKAAKSIILNSCFGSSNLDDFSKNDYFIIMDFLDSAEKIKSKIIIPKFKGKNVYLDPASYVNYLDKREIIEKWKYIVNTIIFK
jgi:hypothetical protein